MCVHVCEREKVKERKKEIEKRQRKRQRQRDRDRESKRERYCDTERQRGRERERKREWVIERERERERDTHTVRQRVRACVHGRESEREVGERARTRAKLEGVKDDWLQQLLHIRACLRVIVCVCVGERERGGKINSDREGER